MGRREDKRIGRPDLLNPTPCIVGNYLANTANKHGWKVLCAGSTPPACICLLLTHFLFLSVLVQNNLIWLHMRLCIVLNTQPPACAPSCLCGIKQDANPEQVNQILSRL